MLVRAQNAATDLPNYFQQKTHIVALQTMIDTAGAKYGLAANLRPRHKHAPVFLQRVQQSVVQLIDVRRIHPVGEVRWTVLETHHRQRNGSESNEVVRLVDPIGEVPHDLDVALYRCPQLSCAVRLESEPDL